MASSSVDEKIRPRLYLISPPEIDLDEFEQAFRDAASGGDIACFQLRLKNQPRGEIIFAIRRLFPITLEHDIAFILNDDPQLARDLSLDGVHVGQEDMTYRDARALVGPDAIVGVTCKNSKHLAMEAADSGADYVAFGAFYNSGTKASTTPADLEILAWWSDVALVPCVAIGGITVENCDALLENGADFLAVGAGVWQYKDGPAAAVAAFNRKIDKIIAS